MYSKKRSILVIVAIGFILKFALSGVIALPAATPYSSNHIVSFVQQKRLKPKQDGDLGNFDFENIRNDTNGSLLAEQQDITLKTNKFLLTVERNQRLQHHSDDSVDTKQNTLLDMNELFGVNEHHESLGDVNDTWQRNKQSIPVLETVRHFVNSVRDGALNHTIPNRNHNHHHQLIGTEQNGAMGSDGGDGGVVTEHKSTNKTEENPAIETEEERVHTEESTEFKLLEVLGSFGSILWNFLMSIQKFFAASSGGASSSSSSQASASSSGGGAAR